jgi:hypothetical protein
LESLEVPVTVQTIGEGVFEGCRELQALELPMPFLTFAPVPSLVVPPGTKVRVAVEPGVRKKSD